jgi:hypothetical protein
MALVPGKSHNDNEILRTPLINLFDGPLND